MPAVLIGTYDQIGQTLIERRARYGFSYYVFSDALLETAAPLVAAMTGK